MTESKSSLPLWPFVLADALLLVLAGLLLHQGHKPLLWWEASLLIVAVGGAAWSLILPFLRRDEGEQSMAQTRLLTDALNQIQRIDQVAAQIAAASNQWREFQKETTEVRDATKGLAGSIHAEAKAFTDFLQRANDGEKAHLRLEVDKLRRAETDWLQVVIHILDHVSALYRAALATGQAGLIEQIGQFHHSCREAVRRIGLSALAVREGEPFDPKLHQLRDNTAPGDHAVVREILAAGYTFQGQLVRRVLVAVKETEDAPAEEELPPS